MAGVTKVENRSSSSRVVDGIRHRHAERLRVLQGIYRELWQRPSALLDIEAQLGP